jgi:hypothetical protein
MTADWNEGGLGTGMEVRQGQVRGFCAGEGGSAKIAAQAAVLPIKSAVARFQQAQKLDSRKTKNDLPERS